MSIEKVFVKKCRTKKHGKCEVVNLRRYGWFYIY